MECLEVLNIVLVKMKYYPSSYWRKSWIPVLILILQFGIPQFGVEGSPLRERRICGLAQCKEPRKFHYRGGLIYSYDYMVNVTTSIQGGPSEVSGLHFSSKVGIKFLTACEAVLSMKDVQVLESHVPSGSGESLKDHFTVPDSKETFSKPLQEFSLRFSYHDGSIEELCPEPGESIGMLNVKRGLLSAFQNTMRRLDLDHKGQEEDIHGRCRVEYKLGNATSSSLTIERSKDISSCGDKFGIFSSVQGTPYHFGTLHQSMPAVSSRSDCEHVVDRNLVAGVGCWETHRLKSLARGGAGAETKIHQILNLLSVYSPHPLPGNGGRNGSGENDDESLLPLSPSLDPIFSGLIPMEQTDVVRRESLQFRHHYHLSSTSHHIHTPATLLTNLCSELKDGVGSGAGDSFESLLTALRGLNSSELMRLSEEATDICEGDRSPFDDALEGVGTASSLHLMKERILKGESSPPRIRSWIRSLTYIPKPDLGLMTSAVDILRERVNYPEILLTFSTLAHSYCRNTPDCSSHRPIDILSRLYKKFFLHTSCGTRQGKDVDQILIYLRGIGNFGLHSIGIQEALLKCITKNQLPEIRVAAIEAFRRMGCGPDMSPLKLIFENELEDAEVRISAFLQLMRCPSYATIQSIKTFLETEQVNQVGSFVESYLRNLQETALPSKAELQGLLSDEKFNPKFQRDFRKFSRNLEMSLFYDDLNFGIGLESNWILSQNSYLPRSAMLNLTVDLFGESINVFEGSLRMENWEYYIESLVGPNGKWRNKELHGILSSFRQKRATPNKRKLRQLGMEFDAMRRYHADPVASVSFKTFGNEIFYYRSVGPSNYSNWMEMLNPFQYLANQEHKIQKSNMFLDSAYIIPTGIGLPLNLTAKASAILKIDTGNEFNSENGEFKVKGKLKPSALVAVTGSMILGTTELQTGIKIKATLRSSTALEGTFHVKGTQLLTAEFGLPTSELELLEYKSELVFIQGKIPHIVGDRPDKVPECSRGLWEEIFGLKICSSSHFNLSPNSEMDNSASPYFPLNGPAFYRVKVERGNPSLLSSKLTYVSVNNETHRRLEGTYGIKTSQESKSFGITFDMDRINQNLDLGIILPNYELKVTGNLERNSSSGKVDLTAVGNNVQLLASTISFIKTGRGKGKTLLKPQILIKLHNRRTLDANFGLNVDEGEGGGISWDGSGAVHVENSPSVLDLRLTGVHNETQVSFALEGDYIPLTPDHHHSPTNIKCKSRIRNSLDKVTREIDTSLSLHSSEFPDYNLEASWKYQKDEESVGWEGDFRMGNGPSWSDQTPLLIHHKFLQEETYNSSRIQWDLHLARPSLQTAWGLEGNLEAHGKSLNSTINFQYAPGKKIESSFGLVRSEGALSLWGMGGSLQVPNQQPLTFQMDLQENTNGTFQGKFGGDWFGKSSVDAGMDFVDRSRRLKLDKEVSLRLEFGGGTPPQTLKLHSQLYSDEKGSKWRVGSEYENRNSSLEIGHRQLKKGSKRHGIYSSWKTGGVEYSLTIESGLDENGLEGSIETQFNSKRFPDIAGGLRVTSVDGIRTLSLDYKWDASGDESKSFHFLTLLDSSQSNQVKYKFLSSQPGTTFTISAEQKQELDKSRSVKGRISWSPNQQILFSGHWRHPLSSTWEVTGEAQTPFKEFKNTSLKLRLYCETGEDFLMNIDGSWGKKGKVSGIVSSKLEVLPPMEIIPTPDGKSEDEEGDIDEEEEPARRRRRRRRRHEGGEMGRMSPRQEQGYKFSFNSNLTSTVESWEIVGISMLHTEHDPLHLKTQIHIQLGDGKELSISTQWDLPRTLKEIWSTRVHFQAKTPFRGYETFDLQGVLGKKEEDADSLATFGIYTDQSQYSITIRGSPLGEDDGSIGFEILTSLPSYDKIFGSLSYGIGPSSRLACQLGWPRVLIGLETGVEWTGSWEEFQVFYTFNSPWEPLQNINTLARIDSSQAEFKFLVNDEGMTAKSEWVLENIQNFDIRLDARSPFLQWRRLGFIAKHSVESGEEYYSQVAAWLNEDQIGYKWEGGKSELDEDDGVAAVINSQLEIDTLLYPTVRMSFSLAQRESKFNMDSSLLLREGPINVSLELHLLDLFRFNEKIRITSPYPGLLELEINLSPAIIPESSLYNLGLETRWRSWTSGWEEGGLTLRIGDQKTLSDALTSDAEDEGEEEEEGTTKKVIVPLTQLFHFHSPWTWAKVIKIEMDTQHTIPLPSSSPEQEPDGENSEENEEQEEESGNLIKNHFPLKTFLIHFNGDPFDINFNIQNEIGEKLLSAGISLLEIQNPISLKFESKLDLGKSEKKLSLHGASHWPKLQEIQLEASFQQVMNFLNMRVDLQTPVPSWEVQHGSLMYAHNEEEEMDTWDLELSSDEYGKLATNIVRSPLSLSIILNTPIQDYTALEFDLENELLEDADEETYKTIISTKIGEKETVRIVLESTIEDNFPNKVKGTVTSTLRGYGQGNLEGMMRGTEEGLNANGQIQWRNEKLTLGIQLKLQEKRFEELDLKVTAPFKGYEKWKVWVKKVEDSNESSDEEEGEEDEKSTFLINMETPWTEFSPLNGKVKIISSPVVIKGLGVSGTGPKCSLNIKTSWILSDWNSFEIYSDSKYSHSLDGILHSLPPSNSLKFKLRNFIPSLTKIQLLDSSIYYQTEHPPRRFGSGAFFTIEEGDSPLTSRMTLRLGSKLPRDSYGLELSSTYDQELSVINSNLSLTLGPPTEIYTSTLQLNRGETSVEGDMLLEWGRGESGSLQSKFNCSSSPGLHVVASFFQPRNPNGTALIGSIDGTWDGTSGRHKFQIQGNRIHPLLVDLDLFLRPPSWDSSLSIISTLNEFPPSHFYFQGNLEDRIYGKIGGKVGNETGFLLCDWLLRNSPTGGRELNASFGIDLPLGKQRSGIVQSYTRMESNGVNGELKLILDDVEHVDSSYNYGSESGDRTESHWTKINIGNQFIPFGLTRRSHYEYSPSLGGVAEEETKSVELVEVFDLVHPDLHKLGAELRMERNLNGRGITVTGIHPLRNVSLSTNYQVLGNQMEQNVTLKWGHSSSLGYTLLLSNLTTESKWEERMEVGIHYPLRIIRISGGLRLEGNSGQLTSQLQLNATSPEERKYRGIINWDTEESPLLSLRKLSAIIKHPSLPQDLRGGGELRLTKGDSLEGKFSLDYSGDPKRRLTFLLRGIPGTEDSYYWNMTTDMRLQHAVTNLDLRAFHSNRHLPHELSIITLIDFKNTGRGTRESKITFELFKQLRTLNLLLANPDEHFQLSCQFKDRGPIYHLVAETNISSYSPSPKAEIMLDTKQPYFRLSGFHGKDGSDGIYGQGGVIDSRNVKFDISESYDNFTFSDVHFFLRMNHSRLVTSKLIWRPELLDELRDSCINGMESLREIGTQQTEKLLSTISTDAAEIYNQVWENAKTTIEPFIEEIRRDSDFSKDSAAFSTYWEEALEANEFYMEDITGLAQVFADQVSVRFSNVFINIREYRQQVLGDTSTSELFEKTLLWFLEQAKDQYRILTRLWDNYKPTTLDITPNISIPFPAISQKLSTIFHEVVDFGISGVELVVESMGWLMNSLGSYLGEILERQRPAISSIVHQVETGLYQVLVNVSDFIYERRDEVVKSSYYQKMAQLAGDVDQFYRDLVENDMSTNIQKYYGMLGNFLMKKPLFQELRNHWTRWSQGVQELWDAFQNLSFVKQIQESLNHSSQNLQWIAEYTNIGELMDGILSTLYDKGPQLLSQTALEAQSKYQQAKTKFIFNPDKGIMEWEQKLPMPWPAFNARPILSELPEYKGFLQLTELFQFPHTSLLDSLYSSTKSVDRSWFPPFDGHAMISSSEYFFTFDGKFYKFSGPGVYLLAGDLVDGNFTVAIDYKGGGGGVAPNIILTASHNTLIIDFENRTLRDPKRPENRGLPIQMHNLEGYRQGQNLIVQSPKEDFSVVCSLVYELCELSVSGWYSRKIGGLLGTMDHEPTTDLIHSNGRVATDINDMSKSWDVSDDTLQPHPTSTNGTKKGPNRGSSSTCNKLFGNRRSPLQPCYNSVDVGPYNEMCLNGKEPDENQRACSAVLAYRQMCRGIGIFIPGPSSCIKCDLNGETMMDGDIKVMDLSGSSPIPPSADILFIVEAKDCNKNLYRKRRMDTLINAMEMEFKKSKITNNRYGVVSFGGEGVFEKPRTIMVGQLFTDSDKLEDHFKRIHTSNREGGSGGDVFGAIDHALNLPFRPGVGKTLILLPCSSCQPQDMTIDFSVIHYALLEQGTTLHILLHQDLQFKDKNIGKKFFGMDNEVAFTKLDGEKAGPLRGNPVLRAQIKVSKKILGYCTPLALGTHGTVFNGKKLQNKREQIVNTFARLFSRRIVKASEPPPCQTCYCSGTKDMTGHLKCLKCDYQTPSIQNQEVDLENETEDDTLRVPSPPDRKEVEEEEDEDMEENVDEDPIEDDYEDYTDGGVLR